MAEDGAQRSHCRFQDFHCARPLPARSLDVASSKVSMMTMLSQVQNVCSPSSRTGEVLVEWIAGIRNSRSGQLSCHRHVIGADRALNEKKISSMSLNRIWLSWIGVRGVGVQSISAKDRDASETVLLLCTHSFKISGRLMDALKRPFLRRFSHASCEETRGFKAPNLIRISDSVSQCSHKSSDRFALSEQSLRRENWDDA